MLLPTSPPRFAALSLAAVILTAPGAAGQAPARALHPAMPDSAVLAELTLRSLGPAVMSGRVADVAVATIPGERPGRVIYAAAAAGGVWKSTNAGITWRPIFDEQPVASIGDVTVAPSNPDIVWVGSGESNNLRSSSWGNGIYKSTDGGATWSHVGLRNSRHVPRILIHPTNPDIVYIAAMGPLWTSGGERGLFKTVDGGATWNRVLHIDETTGITDVVMDPTNPDLLYAAAMQRERKAYSFVAGGPGSGIFKSLNAGATWTRLTSGLPQGDKGRIGLDISLSQPRTVYAYVNAQDGGIFRSDDGGENWTRQSGISSLPWFTGQVRVDPRDPDRVYHIGQALSVSEDGGRQWRRIAGSTHADFHAMWIDPTDPRHIIAGNDGGLYTSHDHGQSWDFAVNLPISTFYAIGVDMRQPFYWVYGGLQDNGTWGGPVASRNRTGITNSDWYRAGGGDGFYAAIDPTDPSVVYVESQNGALTRVDPYTDERKSIRPEAAPGEQLRWNWSSPLLISAHDPNTLYFGANVLFKSTDRGDSWARLGGDLTRQLDRDTLPIMGLRSAGGFSRHEGTAPFGNIATVDESPVRPGLLWVGTDDGLVQVSRDDGRTWRRIDRFPGVPDLTYVSRVVASRHAEATAYATFDGHRDNDFRPYVLKSTDFGQSWTSIASNLPAEGSVHVIREHHRNPDLLFVGTEFGLYVTVNGGAAWSRMHGLPTVAVHDLVIHPRENDLVVGTHGRGIWVLDDITPLEQLAAAARAAGEGHVFAVRPVAAYNLASGPGSPGDREFNGANVAAGAILTYAVNRPAGGTVTLSILDAGGDVVREFAAKSTPGVYRLAWDLRWSSPADEPGRAGEEQEEEPGFGQAAARGPIAARGRYTARLAARSADGSVRTLSESVIEVARDPLVRLTEGQWTELEQWRMRAYRVQRDANALVRRLEDARRGLAQGAPAIAAIDSVLERVRGAQRGPGGGFGGGFGGGRPAALLPRVNAVANVIGGSHFPVTRAQQQEITQAEAELASQRSAADAALRRD